MSTTSEVTQAACPDPRTLGKLLRDELNATEAGPVEKHVGSCPACQHLLQRLVGSMPGALACAELACSGDEEPPHLPDYATLERIDAGGMGVVWRVRDLCFGRSLAVKVMKSWAATDPGLVRRFVEEAQVCGQLAHPFIVPVHTMGRLPDRRPYYTMKLIEGRTLATLLEGELAPAGRRMEAVQIFGQICQAVAFAHSKGVIHRDLKPENVMVGAHGEVQLMDWGLAKQLRKDVEGRTKDEVGPATDSDSSFSPHPSSLAATRAGSVMGTVSYMPPEQAQGRVDQIDRRSDVFALGAILCRILTGTPPYTGAGSEAIHLRAIAGDLDEARARLRDCGADPELIQLVERCLAANKADRPSDGGAVASAVTAYLSRVQERLQEERLQREREHVLIAEERRRRKLWLGLAIAVVVALGLVASGGLYWQGQRSQRHQEASDALENADAQLRAGQFAAARESLTRASDRLGDDGPAEVVGRQERTQAAWQLVQDLEQIQVRRMTATDEGLFDNETAQNSYVKTFATAGYDLTGGDPQEVAERIQRSPVKEPILAAIDNWALVCVYDMHFGPRQKEEEYEQRRNGLLAVACKVDPHTLLGNKVRDWTTWKDRKQLENLTKLALAPRSDLSPRLAALLAELLRLAGENPERLLRAFQQRHPGDFWLNFDLGKLLDTAKPGEALRYYQAALAVRPHHNFVISRMASAFAARRQWDEAVALFQEALARAPRSVVLHIDLAEVLWDKGDAQAAVAQLRESVRLRPDLPEAHCKLGRRLQSLGRFVEGLESLRRGHQIAIEKGWFLHKLAEQWLRDGEQVVELDRRLSAGKPAAGDCLGFATVCFCKTRYAEAVEFYRRAFAQEPKVAGNLEAGHRHAGARAAVLAAAGRGEGTEALDAPRRVELRKQALTWLREDLEAWGRRAKNANARPTIDSTLRLWRRHPNLSGVRDPAPVAQLPAEEQQAWQQFWADVESLLGRMQEGM
jgi:serine/threonine-protein kinase